MPCRTVPYNTKPYRTVFILDHAESYNTLLHNNLPYQTTQYHMYHTIPLVDLSDALPPDFLAFIQSRADLFQARPSNQDRDDQTKTALFKFSAELTKD